MAAQGYVQAQNASTRWTCAGTPRPGRLSELFGHDTLEIDEFVRTLGWRRVAEQELPLLEPETRAALEAYAVGVNAYLEDHSLSEIAVQYTVLGLGGLDYRPEPWTAVDSLAWLKAMAWDLKGNIDEEIERALALARPHARAGRRALPAVRLPGARPDRRPGAVVDGVFEQDAEEGGTRNPERPAFTADQRAQLAGLHRTLERLPSFVGRGDGVGSNSWVVDGEHSATGEPLLANDPHLGVSMPGIWMQMGLHCTTVSSECPLDVAGFTFSGVPGVVIGHNADIAWGFTNLGPDVTDLYLERVDGDEWEQDGRQRPLTTARRPSGCAGTTTSRSRCARPRTARSSATSPTSDLGDAGAGSGRAPRPCRRLAAGPR